MAARVTNARGAPHGRELLDQLLTLTDAHVRDLGPHDLDDLRALFNESLFLFSSVICGGNILDPKLHREMAHYIQLWGSPGWERLIAQYPRDHLKSTVGTRDNALWQICREPDQPVALFNETVDNTKKWLRAIQSIVSGSAMFQAVYRDLLPPGVHKDDTRSMPRNWKWSDEAIDFEGRRIGEAENSISGWGVGSAGTSHHWPKLIIDDPIGQAAYDSEAEMAAARSWFENHIYLMRPSNQGWSYYNGTPWTYNDTSVMASQEFGYKVIRRAALELPDGTGSIEGEPIYPGRFTKAKLLEEYRRDPFKFRAQRMCNPSAGKETSFQAAWLKYGRVVVGDHDEPWFEFTTPRNAPTQMLGEELLPERVPLSAMYKVILCDPAATDLKKQVSTKHARHGLICEGIDQWGRRAILQAKALRCDPKDLIDEIFAWSWQWGTTAVHIEEVSFSNIYRFWIIDLQQAHNQYAGRYVAPVPALTGGRDKDERILGLIPGYRRGDYWLNSYGTGQLVEELTEYPNCATKDLLDAHAYDQKLTPAQEASSSEDDDRMEERSTRDPLTGY